MDEFLLIGKKITSSFIESEQGRKLNLPQKASCRIV